jgi:hypothetical protein
MTSTPLVVLDACVLANFSLCDTLLRLAEPPRLFEPKWSDEIIRETTRTLESKLGWPNSLTAHLEKELRAHFSEAWISGYESLIPRMTNDEKDQFGRYAANRAFTAVCSWYLTTQECAMNAFVEHHKNSIQFGYRCFDRSPHCGMSSSKRDCGARQSHSVPTLNRSLIVELPPSQQWRWT